MPYNRSILGLTPAQDLCYMLYLTSLFVFPIYPISSLHLTLLNKAKKIFKKNHVVWTQLTPNTHTKDQSCC